MLDEIVIMGLKALLQLAEDVKAGRVTPDEANARIQAMKDRAAANDARGREALDDRFPRDRG